MQIEVLLGVPYYDYAVPQNLVPIITAPIILVALLLSFLPSGNSEVRCLDMPAGASGRGGS